MLKNLLTTIWLLPEVNNYFDGALYFWDHFGQKDSHILLEYVGGYAALTKLGAVPAISNDDRIDDNPIL
jgi:hypothetical protein